MNETTGGAARPGLRDHLYRLTVSAMFLALGQVLPFATAQIPAVGNMLLPMHIPVLLCGLICGWQYGGAVGFICPLLRFAIFGNPPMPQGIGMAFELCAYGVIVGYLYGRSRWKCVFSLYRSLLIAMVGGRVVWGAARVVMMGAAQVPFGWEAFLSGALLTAIPGILLQLILIPAIMVALDRAKLVPFSKTRPRDRNRGAGPAGPSV